MSIDPEQPFDGKELMAESEQDRLSMARKEEREKVRQDRIAESRRAAAPLIADLAQVDFTLDMVSDLFNKKLNYKVAIPILLRWLPRMDNMAVKADIVRALSVRWAKPAAAPVLVEEFRRAPPGDSSLKWAIGNALAVVADDSVFNEVVGFVRDRRHGTARQMIVVALGNMTNPSAVDVLIELLADEEIAGHALMALGKLKSKKARPHIEPFLNAPRSWVRKEAKRALSKIDKAT